MPALDVRVKIIGFEDYLGKITGKDDVFYGVNSATGNVQKH